MINQSIRALRASVIGTLLLAPASGCGTDTAKGTPGPEPAPPKAPIAHVPVRKFQTAPAVPVVPQGHVRVTGIVYKPGAQAGIPQAPFTRGTVMVLPSDMLQTYLQSRVPDAIVGQQRQRAFLAEPQLVRATGVASCEIQPDGTFGLWLKPGHYAFCLGDLARTPSSGGRPGAVGVETWFEVSVTDEELQAVIPIFNRMTGELTLLR